MIYMRIVLLSIISLSVVEGFLQSPRFRALTVLGVSKIDLPVSTTPTESVPYLPAYYHPTKIN